MSLVPVVSPAAIRRHWMENQRLSGTSRNVFTNKFRPSRNILLKYFLVQKKAFTCEPVFHCCQRSFPVFDMPTFNRHKRKNWANHEARKKPAYQKRSHVSLRLCWISERAFVHLFSDGLSIPMV